MQKQENKLIKFWHKLLQNKKCSHQYWKQHSSSNLAKDEIKIQNIHA